ncbi:hypothetical protein [Hymenobacter sp. BT491]|uniref:hypothetical protein n=1 Tax=Hymenobacter sp. BT491 TaxID=2766779 RepID=UPI0016538581|nr:hypothetical protein [Hymenobacter sp. BT491]MBC6992237.1 hypothetical protein [Hymenobacter sp. BT491]
MLHAFEHHGKFGLCQGREITLPAEYDAVWLLNPVLWGYRRGKYYGVLNAHGAVLFPCRLPAVFAGYRELGPGEAPEATPATAPTTLYRIGGVRCVPARFWAEQATPLLWCDGHLTQLWEAQLFFLTEDGQIDLRPASDWPYKAEQVQRQRVLLSRAGYLRRLDGDVDAAPGRAGAEPVTSFLPPPFPASEPVDAGPTERARFFAYLALQLQQRRLAPPEPFAVDEFTDYVPYEVACLPPKRVQRCLAHLGGYMALSEATRAQAWQLIYLAWLLAHELLVWCEDAGSYHLDERYAFDESFFGPKSVGQLLDEYALWELAPWLRPANSSRL